MSFRWFEFRSRDVSFSLAFVSEIKIVAIYLAMHMYKHTSFKPLSLSVFASQSFMGTFRKFFAVLPVHIMDMIIQRQPLRLNQFAVIII